MALKTLNGYLVFSEMWKQQLLNPPKTKTYTTEDLGSPSYHSLE